ncbi:MAG: hypothetical protein KBT88_15330 [Gammaproteobacteria bacterium]|nr:hypothetical protein [Gammaproteobacteria bacterium]MBQ0841152.1 hypothetical protein [Gammaproteobacteria bacterium]
MTTSHSTKNLSASLLSIKALPLLLLFTLPNTALASSLTQATNTLCSKIKSCATAQMVQQQLPPVMLQMMTAMLDDTCSDIILPYANKATNAGLEKKSIACIESINTLSCSAVMKGAGGETSECKALERAANEAGINTNIEASGVKVTP